MVAVATASYRPGTNSKMAPATIVALRSASTTIHARRRRMTRTWVTDTIGLLTLSRGHFEQMFPLGYLLEYPLVDHNDVARFHLIVE